MAASACVALDELLNYISGWRHFVKLTIAFHDPSAHV